MYRLQALASVLLLSVHAWPRTVDARTWRVHADGSGDAVTIQAALDSARAGDEVLVSAGRYSWSSQGGSEEFGRSMIRMKSGVRLVSEVGPASTILDAEEQGRVILSSGNDGGSLIEGFTVRGGRPAGTACQPACLYGAGGAILCRQQTMVRIHNNVIVDNHAILGGAGIAIDHGSPSIESNILARNSTPFRGGGIDVTGSTSRPTIVSNTIVANDGGGIACVAGPVAVVRRNIIAWNTQSGGSGRGVFCFESEIQMNCNDVFENTVYGIGPCVSDLGGGVEVDPEFCAVEPWVDLSFTLQSDSPCLPEGNGCHLLMGAQERGCSTVLMRHGSWTRVKSLYVGP
jgi:hypothetical protein